MRDKGDASYGERKVSAWLLLLKRKQLGVLVVRADNVQGVAGREEVPVTSVPCLIDD